MLTFFRRIRKGLLEGGSTQKPTSPIGGYLPYAVGEIALVVIGILIALQINNWNEVRKTKIKERSLYQKIIVDLEQEEKILNDALTIYKNHSNSYEHIYNEIIGKASYDSTGLIYNNLGWHNLYDLIVSNKHASAISEINNEKIVELLNQKTRIEVVNFQAKSKYNDYKDEIVSAFLSHYGIRDVHVLYNLEKDKWWPIYSTNGIRYDRLISQYGTVEFEQILVGLRQTATWGIYNIEQVMKINQKLSIALKEEL